jgi:hypothetical protein
LPLSSGKFKTTKLLLKKAGKVVRIEGPLISSAVWWARVCDGTGRDGKDVTRNL